MAGQIFKCMLLTFIGCCFWVLNGKGGATAVLREKWKPQKEKWKRGKVIRTTLPFPRPNSSFGSSSPTLWESRPYSNNEEYSPAVSDSRSGKNIPDCGNGVEESSQILREVMRPRERMCRGIFKSLRRESSSTGNLDCGPPFLIYLRISQVFF